MTISFGQVVINEIDYDQVGTDTAEYVEIANLGIVSIDLSGWSLIFVNGATTTTYLTVNLSGLINPGGYIVVCGDPVNVVPCDIDGGSDSNLIQNGAPDAIALNNGVSDVDVVSYEGSVAGFTEGTGTTASDNNSDILVGLSRSPASTDTDDNDADFTLRCSTPGAINTLQDTGCDTLPVELGEMNVRVDDGDMIVSWVTLSEQDITGFEVQERIDDAYDVIGFVEGVNAPNNYAYRVENPAPGKHVFRLRIVNTDGSSEYTDDVEGTVALVESFVLSNAYPNPFNPASTFTLTVNRDQHVRVGVYDMLGREMDQLFDGTVHADEVHRFTINGDQLSSGMYFYRVEGEHFSTMKSVVLMK